MATAVRTCEDGERATGSSALHARLEVWRGGPLRPVRWAEERLALGALRGLQLLLVDALLHLDLDRLRCVPRLHGQRAGGRHRDAHVVGLQRRRALAARCRGRWARQHGRGGGADVNRGLDQRRRRRRRCCRTEGGGGWRRWRDGRCAVVPAAAGRQQHALDGGGGRGGGGRHLECAGSHALLHTRPAAGERSPWRNSMPRKQTFHTAAQGLTPCAAAALPSGGEAKVPARWRRKGRWGPLPPARGVPGGGGVPCGSSGACGPGSTLLCPWPRRLNTTQRQPWLRATSDSRHDSRESLPPPACARVQQGPAHQASRTHR